MMEQLVTIIRTFLPKIKLTPAVKLVVDLLNEAPEDWDFHSDASFAWAYHDKSRIRVTVRSVSINIDEMIVRGDMAKVISRAFFRAQERRGEAILNRKIEDLVRRKVLGETA
jgi:hypothetical protein